MSTTTAFVEPLHSSQCAITTDLLNAVIEQIEDKSDATKISHANISSTKAAMRSTKAPYSKNTNIHKSDRIVSVMPQEAGAPIFDTKTWSSSYGISTQNVALIEKLVEMLASQITHSITSSVQQTTITLQNSALFHNATVTIQTTTDAPKQCNIVFNNLSAAAQEVLQNHISQFKTQMAERHITIHQVQMSHIPMQESYSPFVSHSDKQRSQNQEQGQNSSSDGQGSSKEKKQKQK